MGAISSVECNTVTKQRGIQLNVIAFEFVESFDILRLQASRHLRRQGLLYSRSAFVHEMVRSLVFIQLRPILRQPSSIMDTQHHAHLNDMHQCTLRNRQSPFFLSSTPKISIFFRVLSQLNRLLRKSSSRTAVSLKVEMVAPRALLVHTITVPPDAISCTFLRDSQGPLPIVRIGDMGLEPPVCPLLLCVSSASIHL